DFDIQSNVNVRANGIATNLDGYGSLITIQQMLVRSEDDIRKVSHELYNLIQTGSRAQGSFVPSEKEVGQLGFTFHGVHSKNMKITARIVNWRVSPAPRNAFEVIPGRMGIADLGSDTSEKYIKVICNICPQQSFTEVIHLLDDVAEW